MELCNDIREFVAVVGLPQDHVPTMKELSEHGRFFSCYSLKFIFPFNLIPHCYDFSLLVLNYLINEFTFIMFFHFEENLEVSHYAHYLICYLLFNST